jgi:hypothetical protein
VCSFANTLGGWVLIGVANAEPTEWDSCAPHELTDRVREALATNRVNPTPAFAATVHHYGESLAPIGLVRVYESADTPHVMSNGQVFVRSVAQDRNAGRVYRAGGVETQAVLLGLADRGRTGVEKARAKFDPNVAPLAAMSVGISSGYSAGIDARVGLRAIPVTGVRLADWSVSHAARVALENAAVALAGHPHRDAFDLRPYASGLVLTARSTTLLGKLRTGAANGVIRVATDAVGVVSASITYGVYDPPEPVTYLTLNGVRDLVIRPLIEAVVSMLEAAEALGRTLLELRFSRLEPAIGLDNGERSNIPSNTVVGGELALPQERDGSDITALAERWRAEVGRAAGYPTLLP